MKAKILKKLEFEGKVLMPGDVVDVSSWRNTRTLEGSRYITFVQDEVVVEEKPKPVAQVKPKKPKSAE